MEKVLLILFLLIQISSVAQKNFPVNGVHNEKITTYAFTNAKIYVDHQQIIENATLLIKNNIIQMVGKNVKIPKAAIIKDLSGKTIYPSFIDMYSTYGLKKIKVEPSDFFAKKNRESSKSGAFGWNEAIRAEYNTVNEFKIVDKSAGMYRKRGFGAVLSHKNDGISRGTSVFVTLGSSTEQQVVLVGKSAAHYSFNKGSSKQAYPGSLMGAAALLRQTFYDAKWYKSSQNTTQNNQSLMAFNQSQKLPQIFEVKNKYQLLLADKIGDEFGVQYIMKGSGDEYQLLEEIKNTNATLIVPVNFPKTMKITDPFYAINIPLAQLKHWEMAPVNLSKLKLKNISFAITSFGLGEKDDFLANIRKAVKYGLSENEALKAMTLTPAKLLRINNKLGSIEKGKLANFIICSGNIFKKGTVIYENWIQGEKYIITDIDTKDLSGSYTLIVGSQKHNLKVSGKLGKNKFEIIKSDSIKKSVRSEIKGKYINLSFKSDKDSTKFIRLAGLIKGESIEGNGQLADGSWIKWSAGISDKTENKKKKSPQKEKGIYIGKVIYPFIEYGWKTKPVQENILFKNATVWTSEAEGIISNTDVLVKSGKIVKIGKNLKDGGATVVNAEGKHLTAGIIDEHSHIALFDINEFTESVTSEVRMYDVINPEDITIYRQLAGGVTAAQLLHGSANPIGGQSAIIKLRWGSSPSQMKISNADGFIKFALGENVKQTNWGDKFVTRFPQTRMGVEQVYVDAFTRTKKYINDWEQYRQISQKNAKLQPPRKDLELEALAEIMKKQRFITCHSYIQSEINMLMKVAEKFGFRINTFTHILEGYKVADKMAKHGVAGSTFSDWWAYKYEVREAIPYNAALMSMAGVTVAINSDDHEMGRRLNQEAGKTVKYGGVSELEAWKMVTINPAKMLHLDKHTGSIKVGKDADLVLWSDNPLSIYAKVEKTLVDGIVYFDREQDKMMRKDIADERNRLINKMIIQKKK